MADVFNARGSLGGVFKGTSVAVTLGNGANNGNTGQVGSLVQRIAITYRRNVTRIWELGSDNTYYVIGHTEGSLTMERIVAAVTSDILDALADACTALNTTLNISSNANACANGASLSLQASGPVLVSRGFGADAGQFVFTSSAEVMISGLSKS